MHIVNGNITTASILIAAGDDNVRQSLADTIDIIGISLAISTARDALSTIQAAKTELPDILILDQTLPPGSGPAVAAEIHRSSELKYTKIILLTGHEDSPESTALAANTSHTYIHKPFEMADLEARVLDLLNGIQQSINRDNWARLLQ